jgi:hypothetical protein
VGTTLASVSMRHGACIRCSAGSRRRAALPRLGISSASNPPSRVQGAPRIVEQRWLWDFAFVGALLHAADDLAKPPYLVQTLGCAGQRRWRCQRGS